MATSLAAARAKHAAYWPWDGLIAEASRRFAIPEAWVRGVMRVESGGRAMLGGRPIISSAGAMGLMQLMPATFADMTRRYGLGDDPYEPRANILAGAAFLRELYDRYGPDHFLAAYNAGPRRVDDHLRTGRPLPAETRRYVQLLGSLINENAGAAAAASSSQLADQTHRQGTRLAAPSSFRPFSTASVPPRFAPLFAVVSDISTAGDVQADEPPGNTLFVRHPPIGRRQDEASGSGMEN